MNNKMEVLEEKLKGINELNLTAQSISPIILIDEEKNIRMSLDLSGDNVVGIKLEC